MAEARHKEITNNIANIDTPYYKARDINVTEFRELLGEAIQNRRSNHPWHFQMKSGRDVQAANTAYHFHMKGIGDLHDGKISTGFKRLKRMDDTVMRHDQNNVTPEGEMSLMMKNSLLHSVFTTIAKDNFTRTESAIRMRV